MGGIYGCGEQEAGVASGSGWKYIDSLILLIPILLLLLLLLLYSTTENELLT